MKPEKGGTECPIADGNGLYIRVRASYGGFSRTWQYRRKESGKPSITTLGTYPELSIKEARRRWHDAAMLAIDLPNVGGTCGQSWLRTRGNTLNPFRELDRDPVGPLEKNQLTVVEGHHFVF